MGTIGGWNAALVVLGPDLNTVCYSGCFFTADGAGAVSNAVVVRPDRVTLGSKVKQQRCG